MRKRYMHWERNGWPAGQFENCGSTIQFYAVILSEAKNLSFFSPDETSKRFFASLRMTNNFGTFF